jgi:catechol 2,3-dioxygenase-like lactoylglutathione lyase family enzyme
MTVASAGRATEFFTHVLDFRSAGESVVPVEMVGAHGGTDGAQMRRVRLELGTECIELNQPLGGVRRTMPSDSRSNDHWFQHVAIVVRDMDKAYDRLERMHVEHASIAPQRLPDWNPNAGGIRAYYFKDPDGHTLEIIWFPPGKGQPRWQSPAGDALFLGIDHTAIAVADTDASLRFYAGQLGLKVAGRSENWGPEQERLNAVPGARLRITTLRAPVGPGVELLEYLSPRDGRQIPADECADDVIHWRTTLWVEGRSPSALRDPDGHVLEVRPEMTQRSGRGG